MILVIDNYDSFTYNLVQYLSLAGAETEVVRNDEIVLSQILALRPNGILLSPGPCTPRESGVCLDVAAAATDGDLRGTPIFGVCLGHQALGHRAGSIVERAPRIRHGKASPVRHDGQGVFADMPNPFQAVRYHSLAIRPETVSPDYMVTATAEDDGVIMGIRHRILPIEGVQFHPESVLTEEGLRLVTNWVKSTVRTAVH